MTSIKVAYYIGTHRGSFRSGEPAEIVGVRMVKPGDYLPSRPCFELRYADGTIDWSPIADGCYEIVDRIPTAEEPAHGHDRR